MWNKIGTEHRKINKIVIIDENFHVNIMVNVNEVESLLNKRAMMPQNRAQRCIFCDRKGTFRKPLLQKGFLTQIGLKIKGLSVPGLKMQPDLFMRVSGGPWHSFMSAAKQILNHDF